MAFKRQRMGRRKVCYFTKNKKTLNSSRFFNSYYSPTYGNNPICLARLIATANCL